MRRNYETNISEKNTTKTETRHYVRQTSNDSTTPGYMRPANKKPNEHKEKSIPGYMKSTKSQEQKQTQQLEQNYVELNQCQEHNLIDNTLDQETELIPSPKDNIPGYMKPTKTFQENVEISRKRILNDDSTNNKTSKIQVTLENRKVKQNEDVKCKVEESFYLKRSTSPQKKSPNDKDKFPGIIHESPKVIKRAPSPKKAHEKLTSPFSHVEPRRPSSPKKSYEKLTNTYSNVESKRPSSPQKSTKETTPRRSSSPHKINEHHDILTKKISKTELQIELRSSSIGEYLFFI